MYAGRRWIRALTAVTLPLLAAGCDLLEGDGPAILIPEELSGPDSFAAVYETAVAEFASAYSGPSSHLVYVGLLSDEFVNAGTSSNFRTTDLRAANDGLDQLHYFDLQRARASLESTAELLADPSLESPDPRHAELLALAGYTHVFLAEVFCSGSPLGGFDDQGKLAPGSPYSTEELLNVAIERFGAVLVAPGASAHVRNLSQLGKARALTFMGLFDEAARLVSNIPTEFRYVVVHSQDVVVNGMHAQNSRNMSLSNGEGANGLPFRLANDPRVPWRRSPPNALGGDGVTPLFTYLTYDSFESPTSVATGVEARLIEAEAALAAGDAAWVRILRDLRDGSSLDFSAAVPVRDTGSVDANVDLLFSERAFWLFATGHRVADMRRLIRQYGRDAEEVFPTGEHHMGGVYSTGVNLAIPNEELANPQFMGCLDQEA